MKRLPVRAAVLSAAILLTVAPAAALATSPINQSAVDNGLAYLGTQQGADGSIAGFSGVSAWAAMAFAAAGTDPATVSNGGQSLLQYLEANPPAAGASATEWERDILAITAAGQNPYDFGGTNYVAGLKTQYHDHQIGSTSADNDDFFGVAALIAAHQPITDPALTDALAVTLANQHASGGFSYSTDPSVASDVDDTAAAAMALDAAEDAGLTVPQSALDNIKAYLLGKQNADGGFPYDASSPDSNVSSSSWALMALQVLDAGNTSKHKAAAYLRGTQQPDGSFPYTAPGAGDTFDSAYAIMALADGYWPLKIYDGTVPADPSPSPSPGAVLGASTGGSGAGPATLPVVGAAGKGLLALAFTLTWLIVTFVAIRSRRA